MKTILSICIILLLITTANAQDTLKKVIEYDITIDGVAKMDLPLIKYLIKDMGNKSWLEILMQEIIAGEIAAYDVDRERIDKETIRKHTDGEIYDTIYTIDPITFEETIEIIPSDKWDVKEIKFIRFSKQWTWNEDLKEMQLDYWGFTPMMRIYRKEVLVGHLPLFWIKLNN